MTRAHYDEHAECLVVEVEDEHLEQPVVRLVHWLVQDSGEFTDFGVRLYPDALRDLIEDLTAALQRIQPPTEGGTADDTTGQGSSGGETAAEDDRAGADSREVGAAVSEVPPAAEEGGAGSRLAGASLQPGQTVPTVQSLFDLAAQHVTSEAVRALMNMGFRTAFSLHPSYWHEYEVRLLPTSGTQQ